MTTHTMVWEGRKCVNQESCHFCVIYLGAWWSHGCSWAWEWFFYHWYFLVENWRAPCTTLPLLCHLQVYFVACTRMDGTDSQISNTWKSGTINVTTCSSPIFLFSLDKLGLKVSSRNFFPEEFVHSSRITKVQYRYNPKRYFHEFSYPGVDGDKNLKRVYLTCHSLYYEVCTTWSTLLLWVS